MPTSDLKRLARRLARPLTAPVDGRVADINRRVGDASARVERLEGAVGTFAEASAEASSFVGVELGRMAAALDGVRTEIQQMGTGMQQLGTGMHQLAFDEHERHYRRRVAEAIGLPLERLEGDLAAVLNHASGYRGFAAQAGLWFNPPLNIELTEGRARLASANERIVELPFAMTVLGRLSQGARVLDVGSAESTFPLSAASLGYRVTAVDPRGLPYEHPNLITVSGRLEDLPAPDEPFAAVFLISTIEHVGLPAYGVAPRGEATPGAGADREVLERIGAELLQDDGLVVVTTPYGAVEVTDFERTYDDDALGRLFEGWEILQRVDVARHGPLEWSVLPAGEAVEEDGVAMIVARPAGP